LGTQDTGLRQSRDTTNIAVSLDCLSPVSCVPNVGCVSGLFQSCVLCTQCWLCLWIVSGMCNPETQPILGTQDTGLKQSRETTNIGYTRHRTEKIQRHSQHVGCVSGLSQSCVLCTQCWLFLWIVSVLCLVYPILAVSLDFLSPVSCGLRQSRETANIGYTRHRTETIQRHSQHWVHKT
jgi:hypothetical protein